MSIVHSDAGEGNARPEQTLSHDVDADARRAHSCDSTNLPWVTFRATFRAANLQGLHGRARSLLAALARTVDAKNPYAAIFARRELLTDRALLSMRTLYRGLDDLETAGLIERSEQRRLNDIAGYAGRYGRAYIHLTAAAARLLGFLDQPAVDTPAAKSTAPDKPSVHFPNPSATVADGSIYRDLSPKLQKRQPATLPPDLQRLMGLGFHKFLIYKLMGVARQNQKRLSDVVEATWDSLKKAAFPINYVQALLRSPKDFSQIARAKHDQLVQRDKIAERQRRTATAIERYVGKTFYDKNLTRRITLSQDGLQAAVLDAGQRQPRVTAGVWHAEFLAAVDAGHLVEATSATDDVFNACVEKASGAAAPRQGTVSPTSAQTIGEHLQQIKRLARGYRAAASVSV
jgi:hypothetical protein